ncbi:MAG: DPP IV N-terminal domain-containing protein, partial [Acidobacteriota bacterium]|nr:DPP IV N-terminal domain-containing protein [Acidobacteriota bacterium]
MRFFPLHRRALPGALCLIVLLAPHAALVAQTPAPKKFELTVDSIMRGPALVGYAPLDVRWSRDNRRVYFRWKRADEARLKEFDTYVVNRDGGGLRKLSEDEAKQAPPASGESSKDKTLTVFTEDGDVYLYDHTHGARRQVTDTTEAETNAHFTRDQKHVSFTRQNNLYRLALDGGSLTQLTDIRVGGGGGDQTAARGSTSSGSAQRQGGEAQQQRGTESQELLKKEERELLEAVRERAARREEQEAKRKARERRKPFNIPSGQNVSNLTLSPDGQFVIAIINEPPASAKNTIVPNYVTETGYTEDIPSRTKVGDVQGKSRMVSISVETGEVKNVDHGQRVDPAPTVRARTEANVTEQVQRERGAEDAQTTRDQQAQQQQGQQQGQPPPPQQQQQQQQRTQTEATQQSQMMQDRAVQLFQLQWSDDGRNAVMLARSVDNKDRWALRVDPATGKANVLARMHDDAWVGGPGAFTLGWLPDNQRVYFQSEQDGFAHLYTANIDGGEPVQLTSGQFEVSGVQLSPDKTKFYFTSSEGSPFERHLYSMPIAGGARTRLTSMPGNNLADVSPDEKTLAIVRSYSNKPPELYLAASTPQQAEAKQVTTSPLSEFFTYNWIAPPIVNFKARDGATVHARLYKPANFKRGGPAVVFVHGAGYLLNVHIWWSNYYREFMFHHLLMERGYT